MEEVILKIENLSKQYRLGTIGTGTISHDLNRWWAKIRGKEDPYLKIGESNDRASKGKSQYVWALKDINFEVNRGEVLGIIGKNGAGKSTLLKILSKVTSPTTGSIKSRGRIASLLEVGTGFHPEMTGRENVFLNGAILGMTKKEIALKLDEIIEFSGCERYIDTPVKRYSSGMKVRLAFAVAAFLEPDILVVDEVLAVGDAEFQKKAIGKMQDISKGDGRTVLFVSHDMAAIQSLCSRLFVLDNGKVGYEGGVIKGIDFYLSEYKLQSNNDLKSIIHREGHGKMKFSRIDFSYELNNNLIENTTEIPSGVKLFIDLTVENYQTEISTIFISIRIANLRGFPITNMSNEFTNDVIKVKPGKNIIRFEMPSFDLREGEFLLTLWGKDDFGVFDKLEECKAFKVIPSNFFGTGKYPNKKIHGVFLMNNKSYCYE